MEWLDEACTFGYTDMAYFALKSTTVEQIIRNDNFALRRACSGGYNFIVELILDRLTLKDLQNLGEDPFFIIAQYSRPETLQLFVNKFPELEEHFLSKNLELISQYPPK